MKNIFALLFNVAETLLIFMIGKILKVPANIIIIIMGVFFVSRLIYGKPKHYNKWYRCCIWSSLVFTSLYAISNLDLVAIIILTSFTGLISTGKADIKDIYMWKGKESKYQDIIDYIKFNPLADDLLDFENKLKSNDTMLYMLYKYKFKDNKTFTEISNLLDIETNRITELLDKIAFTIRMYCKI